MSVRERVRNGRSRAPVILMYHRVATELTDPWGLCVSAAHFEEHLDALRRHAHPLPLVELHRALLAGTAAPGSVALTFDDGYADNLLAGVPLLRQFAVPATVFVTTGYTARGREFWWDELERLLLEPAELPSRLEFEIAGRPHRLDLAAAGQYPPASAARHPAWRAYASTPPTARHAAFLATWEQLLTLRDADQWDALASLAVATGASAPRPARRQLTPVEIDALARDGLVEVGAHTVTHPALPLFPPHEQAREIAESGQMLAAMLGRPVMGFSYPHGRFADVTVELVRDAGYAYACAATPSPAVPANDLNPFLLGRLMVPDCDGDGLLRLLNEGAHVG